MVELYLSRGQKGGKIIVGHKLRKQLADQPVLNANVLDYLLQAAVPHSQGVAAQERLLLGHHLPPPQRTVRPLPLLEWRRPG
jgi:hypothetical protein